jgi:hypothetical protein
MNIKGEILLSKEVGVESRFELFSLLTVLAVE